jgi:penicillin amidase
MTFVFQLGALSRSRPHRVSLKALATKEAVMRKLIYSILALVLAVVVGLGVALWGSLPKLDGEISLDGLSGKVVVEADGLGIPTIRADNRLDALRAMGWLHARDRLFQMDLMRRKGAGRLAELFGAKALDLDKKQRVFGFEPAAQAIFAALPQAQRLALGVYAEGVNAFLAPPRLLPPEFLLLRYSPEPWRPEDSLLVGLGMFQTLNSDEDSERMLSVMEQALPPALVQFLTPDVDEYSTVLLGGSDSSRPARPIPAEEWAALGQPGRLGGGVAASDRMIGSNNWAVVGSKTADGRAIVADDMHLSLGVPNIWYRAALRYAGHALDGVTLPGFPLLVVGSNGHVAWGFTNVDADVLDLVGLDINPANPDEYQTPQGWQRFDRRVETIKVRGGADVALEVKTTRWGPLSAKPLLGKPVAIHWTALQADAVDMGLLDMDGAATLEQAVSVINRFGGPNQNVALADDLGHIGWTLLGRYPARRGFDGSVSRSWADGTVGWDGYLPPSELPRLIDPPQGYLATANNRTLGSGYPHVIAHNQANSYRAYRISQRLAEKEKLDEKDLFAIQLDTRSEFFEFYRRLALASLDREARQDPVLDEARRAIEAWNGRMDADSLGIGLLWLWREKLAAAIFAPVVARCRQIEPDFSYSWREMETPLRSLLTQRLPKTLPDASLKDWRELLLKTLAESVAELKQRQGVASLDGLAWGDINHAPVRHPFSKAMPFLSRWLDMDEGKVSGCAGFCVRIVGNGHGASERLVVSPGHPQQGILHMPGGQSGHPFSAHYSDQQAAWRNGTALPFLPGASLHQLVMEPSP